MQDWFTDSHDTFHRALKTATMLHDEAFTTCSTCEQKPWFSFFLMAQETTLSWTNRRRSCPTSHGSMRDTTRNDR